MAEQTIESEGWSDVLQTCSHSEIRQAWARYQTHGPRTAKGRLYKPDAGAIYKIIMDARPKPEPVAMQRITEEKPAIKTTISREKREEMLTDAGYQLNEHGGVILPDKVITTNKRRVSGAFP